MTAGKPLVSIRKLSKRFGTSRALLSRLGGSPARVVRAVDGVSFDIPDGRTFALVGESGCGKSTIARCLAGILPPSGGEIFFRGENIADASQLKSARGRLQMIFQDPYASLNPRWRVGRIVAEPIVTHRLLATRAEIKARVDELLSLVGLTPSDAQKFPHQFSGGQRQRISIARALSSRPDFLICDEPTSALDVSVQAQVLNLMKRLQSELGLTTLLISHNLAVVAHMADFIGVMYLGRLVEQGPAEAILDRPAHPYTRLLLETVPSVEPLGAPSRTRRPLAGEVPSPMAPPPGCSFHPRCPWSNERCRAEAPPASPQADGRTVSCHAVSEGRLEPLHNRSNTELADTGG